MPSSRVVKALALSVSLLAAASVSKAEQFGYCCSPESACAFTSETNCLDGTLWSKRALCFSNCGIV
jgi:hypothetical protein